MSNFCGGLKMSPTALTIVNGIITIPGATPTAANAVSVCGQLFDGAIFKGEKYNGHKMITYANAPSEIDVPYMIKANCGLGLDPRYFTVENKTTSFEEHLLLEINVTNVPIEDIDLIWVYTGSDPLTGEEVEPFGDTNIYFLEADGVYGVSIKATGHIGYTETFTATDNRVMDITLPELTTITFAPTPSDATIVVKEVDDGSVVGPIAGNAYRLGIGVAYTYTVTKANYVTETGSITPTGEATVTVTLDPELAEIVVTTPPTKTAYTTGESFDPAGMVITANYMNGATAPVTGYTYAPNGALTGSDTTITITYTENDITQTATQAITVS